jgi:chemotaxis protein MotB
MSSKEKGKKTFSAMAQDDHGEGGGGGHDGGGGLRWLLTYADMITLLLVFFIIMFVISDTNSKKFELFAKSVAKGFHAKEGPQTASSTAAQSAEEVGNTAAKINPEDLLKQFTESFSTEMGYGFINLARGKKGITMKMEGSALFEVGSAVIKEDAKKTLKKLAGDLRYVPNRVSVEGHTDSTIADRAEFPTNWELSAKRAVNIVRFLVEVGGVDPRKLSAAAYGEYQPLVPDIPNRGSPENRRVEIILLDEKAPFLLKKE